MKNRLVLLALCLVGVLGVLTLGAQEDARTLEYRATINSTQPFIEYPLTIPAGGRLVADMRAVGDPPLDGILYLVDSGENIVIDNDDRNGKYDRNPYLDIANLRGGEYKLIATRHKIQDGKSEGEFVLTVTIYPNTPPPPQFDLSEAALRQAGYPIMTPNEPKAWTIFAYYGGDNNLEQGIIDDLREFEQAGGSDETLNIVVFVDRHPEYYTSTGNWFDARVFYVEADETITTDELQSQELANLGTIDSGNPQTFAQFISWGITHYPAEHYALAFGGHGEGWRGIVPDYTASSTIQIKDLERALQAVVAQHGQSFDLLVNDACHMGSVEYLTTMSAFFEYALVSPEIVYNPALDMAQLVNTLKKSPNVPIPELGEQLVNTYIERDMANSSNGMAQYTTSALFDLKTFPQVQRALDDFSLLVNADPSTYLNTLVKARNQSFAYPQSIDGASLLDLGDFLNNILKNSVDRYLVSSVTTLQKAIENSLIYANRSPRARTTAYLNIYFPPSRKTFDAFYYSRTSLNEWLRFLRNYFDTLDPQDWRQGSKFAFHSPNDPQVTIVTRYPEVANADQMTQFKVEVVGRNLTSGYRFVDGQTMLTQEDGSTTETRVRWLSEPIVNCVVDQAFQQTCGNLWQIGVGTYYYDFSQYLYTLSDETQTYPVSFFTTSDGTTEYDMSAPLLRGYVQARYRQPNNENWDSVTLLYAQRYIELSATSTETSYESAWTFEGALGQGAEGAVAPVTLPVGAQVQLFVATVGEDGTVLLVPDKVLVWGEAGLQLTYAPMPTGTYEIGVQVYGFGDRMGQDSVSLTVTNLPIDDSAYTVVDLKGNYEVTLSADWSWYAPSGSNERTIFAEDSFIGSVLVLDRFFADINSLQAYFNERRWGNVYEEDGSPDESVSFFATDDGVGFMIPGDTTVIGLFSEEYETASIYREQFISGMTYGILDESAFYGNWDEYTDFQNRYKFKFPENWWELLTPENDPEPIYYQPVNARGEWLDISPRSNDQRASILSLKVKDSAQVLDALWRAETATYENVVLESRRRYRAERHTWEVLIYTATVDGVPYRGRIYLAQQAENGYAIHLQAKESDDLLSVWQEALEPIVDSFEIVPTRAYQTDYAYGYELPYPATWTPILQEDDPDSSLQSLFLAVSQDELNYLGVLILRGTRANAESVLLRYLEEGYTLTSMPYPVRVGGLDGLAFEYRYVSESDLMGRAKAIAFYDSSRGHGLIIEAGTDSYALEEYHTNYEQYIVQGLRWFERIVSPYTVPTTPYKNRFFALELPPNMAFDNTEQGDNYSADWYLLNQCNEEICPYVGIAYFPVALNPDYETLEDFTDFDEYSQKRQITLDERTAWRFVGTFSDQSVAEIALFYLPEMQTVVEISLYAIPEAQADVVFSTLQFTYEASFNPDDLLANAPIPTSASELGAVLEHQGEWVEDTVSGLDSGSLVYNWATLPELSLIVSAFEYPAEPPDLDEFAFFENAKLGVNMDILDETAFAQSFGALDGIVFTTYYADSRGSTRLVYGLFATGDAGYYTVLLETDELFLADLLDAVASMCDSLVLEEQVMACDPDAFINPLTLEEIEMP